MRRIFLVLIATTSCSCVFAASDANQAEGSFEQMMAQGTEKMKIRSYPEAEKCFRGAVQVSKGLQARAVDSLAAVLQMQGKKNEADECLKQKEELLGAKSVSSTPAVVKSAQFEADLKAYLNNLHNHVIRFWFPPRDPRQVFQNTPDLAVTVKFVVDGKGELSELKIRQSSGDRSIDFAAMQAVLDGKPYLPLPAGFPSSIPVEITLRTGGGNLGIR